jgi:hypothetical protein
VSASCRSIGEPLLNVLDRGTIGEARRSLASACSRSALARRIALELCRDRSRARRCSRSPRRGARAHRDAGRSLDATRDAGQGVRGLPPYGILCLGHARTQIIAEPAEPLGRETRLAVETQRQVVEARGRVDGIGQLGERPLLPAETVGETCELRTQSGSDLVERPRAGVRVEVGPDRLDPLLEGVERVETPHRVAEAVLELARTDGDGLLEVGLQPPPTPPSAAARSMPEPLCGRSTCRP